MNSDHFADDRLADAIASLPVVDLDPARAEEIRARSRAALGRHARSRSPWTAAAWPAWRRVLEPALVAGVSAAFLLEVVGRALSLEGF